MEAIEDNRERDYVNLVQLMEEALCMQDLSRTNLVVGGLVQHIVQQCREAICKSAITKFTLLLPLSLWAVAAGGIANIIVDICRKPGSKSEDDMYCKRARPTSWWRERRLSSVWDIKNSLPRKRQLETPRLKSSALNDNAKPSK